MKIPQRRTAFVVIVLLLVGIGVSIAGMLYLNSFGKSHSLRNEQTLRAVIWRLELYAHKAIGSVPDLSWTELWQMTRTRGGFGLAAFITDGQSIDGSVVNSYVTDEDLRAGAQLFKERCSVCHGGDGAGWHGAPPLNRSGLKHGDSDFALYKVIRDGIAGTPMVAPDLNALERWQIVGHVRTLQVQTSARAGDEAAHLDIQVSRDRLLAAGTRSDEWLTYSGALDGRRYAPTTEITPANVSQLRIRWVRQFDTDDDRIRSYSNRRRWSDLCYRTAVERSCH